MLGTVPAPPQPRYHPYIPTLPLALQRRVDELQAENAQLQSALTGLRSEVAQVCAGPTLPMPVAPKALVQGGPRHVFEWVRRVFPAVQHVKC